MLNRFLDDGYMVVPGLIPDALCQRVIDAIDEFISGWDESRFDHLGIVPLHHHEALWAVRQYPALYDVFRAIYQQDELWVSMDRAGYKPRESERTSGFTRARVHWDCDPWTFSGLAVQGLVYLTDTESDQGAFACAPNVYQNLDAWLSSNEGDEDRRYPSIDESDLVSVPAPAGSLVIFHRLMPHTNLINRTALPRYVQYVTMQPAGDEEERVGRVKDWEEKVPPEWAIRQKVNGQMIPEPGSPALLTELGKKLVGVTPW
jgi:hypothetical protein